MVPAEQGSFISGEGVLYAGNLVASQHSPIVPKYTKDELLANIELVSEDYKNPSYA